MEPDWDSVGRRRRGGPDSPTPEPRTPTPTPKSPYPVRRFTCLQSVKRVDYNSLTSGYNTSSKNSVPLENLASGTIIAMWADLERFGFSQNKRTRWFVVLGKLEEDSDALSYVILPLATFSSKGKNSSTLQVWASQYFKDVHREAQNVHPNCDSKTLDPNQALHTQNHKTKAGEVLALSTAFIVTADEEGCIPAEKSGYLVEESVKNVWHSFEHLRDIHPEYRYLLGTNMRDWDKGKAMEYIMKDSHWMKKKGCREEGCYFGSELNKEEAEIKHQELCRAVANLVSCLLERGQNFSGVRFDEMS
ncbi:hypothetical protein GQ44DRAFT_773263 [Phaeosphaeriaceae sp. PMI808]|nr:hypothetical protein GQ44DRAFT_773263 [Phaeosphaeriaceae sp. PMI808]